MTYTTNLVIAILENFELIDAFVQKTTQELFKVGYEYPDDPEFWAQEGNTLQDRGSHNSRIPKLDRLKENLIVMKADVEMALQLLEPADQISVLYHFQLAPAKANNRTKIQKHALEAVEQMVAHLNNGN